MAGYDSATPKKAGLNKKVGAKRNSDIAPAAYQNKLIKYSNGQHAPQESQVHLNTDALDERNINN